MYNDNEMSYRKNNRPCNQWVSGYLRLLVVGGRIFRILKGLWDSMKGRFLAHNSLHAGVIEREIFVRFFYNEALFS